MLLMISSVLFTMRDWYFLHLATFVSTRGKNQSKEVQNARRWISPCIACSIVFSAFYGDDPLPINNARG